MLPIYISFFNLILETGIIPASWLEGVIKPIYKRTGDPKQPENYRPITILSCLGKLFTAILNHKLNNFLKHNNILKKTKLGSVPDTLRSITYSHYTYSQSYLNGKRKSCFVYSLTTVRHLIQFDV